MFPKSGAPMETDAHFQSFRVRTHQQSRVESNPVQADSHRRGSDSGFLTMAAAAVRTHQHSRVEAHESCRVKSRCPMFHFRQTLVIGVTAALLRKKWMWKSLFL